MNVKLTLSERIQDEMNKKGLSNSDLCKKANIPPNTLSQFLSGQVENPKAHNLIKLSKGLNVSIDYLLGLQDDPTTNVDLQAISNEYGISSKAMKNIKKQISMPNENDFLNDVFISSHDTSPEDKEQYKKEVLSHRNALNSSLNIFLESRYLGDFIEKFSKYLVFYPHEDFETFVSVHNTFCEENIYEDNFNFGGSFQSFLNDRNKMIVNSNVFDELLLESLKDDIHNIKKETTYFKDNVRKEIEFLKSDIKTYESSNYEFWVEQRKKAKNKIIELERILND